jgi:hypothetical protein
MVPHLIVSHSLPWRGRRELAWSSGCSFDFNILKRRASEWHYIDIIMNRRAIVSLYKFEKVPNIRGRGQEYKVTNNLTGEVLHERTADKFGKLREKGGELYYVDTQTRLLDEYSSDGDAPCVPFVASQASASVSSNASAPTAPTIRKTLNRSYSWQQQYDILNEVLYGSHVRKCGTKIEFVDRCKHGNLGPFFASVCTILNDGISYPSFSKSKAVDATVRHFVDNALADHKSKLTAKFGCNFIEHEQFMEYSPSESSQDDELGDKFYQRQIMMFLDALVFADVSEGKEESVGESRHSESQEKELQEKQVDGKLRKRPRVEKVKEKAINHVAQLQEQHNGLTSLINSIVSMTSEGPRPAAAEPVDPGVIAIKNTLTALATPPGLPAVCQKLAEGLAGYGFCTLQELLTIRDSNYHSAFAILTGLQWSPLQVNRVLGDAPNASA